MGKKAPSAPAAPDPAATAAAQSATNRETATAQAMLNNYDQRTPYGSLSYNEGPTWSDGTPHFVATQTLSPAEQSQLDLSNQASDLYGRAAVQQLGQASNTLSTPFSPGSAPQSNVNNRSQYINFGSGAPSLNANAANYSGSLGTSAPDRALFTNTTDNSGSVARSVDTSRFGSPDISRDAVQNALYSRISPMLDQQRQGLETRLTNQGLSPGSEAWGNAMRDQAQSENDARYGAIINGGQEQSRLYGLAQSDANFRNAATAQTQGLTNTAQSLYNQTQTQGLQNDLARLGFGNTAYGQAQDMSNSAMQQNNATNTQDFQNRLGYSGFVNQALGQADNMDLANAGFFNNAQQQGYAQALQTRNQPINEASALLTGQMIQNPSFVNTPQTQIQPTDYLGAVGLQQGALNNAYNQKNANYQSNLSGMYGLGSAAIGAAMAGPIGAAAGATIGGAGMAASGRGFFGK